MFDVAIGVSRLPGTIRALLVDIDRRIAVDGTVTACSIAKSGGVALYDALACRHAGAPPVAPVRDRSGAPVEGVMTETIMFVRTPALDPDTRR